MTAVAPSGYNLPTANGLPNKTNSVYDLAYGVTNTQSGQNVYGSSRPAQITAVNQTWGQINVFDPTALNGITTNPAFPSGHTTCAYTDSILIGMLVPQEYQNMLSRASEYANNRIVLGVHYPLDIIASRSFVQYELAQAFTNPAYINNAATTGPFTASTQTGTAINLPSLFTAARTELNGYLSAGCGASVASCASSSANTANNPYVPSAANAATYAANLTYGLPTLSYAQAPREAAPSGGPDASILLAPLYGGSTSAAQTLAPGGGIDGSLQTSTINQIVVNTETNALAAFYGTSLSYWSRINLYAAAGYFSNLIGVLNMASSDVVTEPVTVGSTGVLVDNGKIVGATIVGSGGTLGGVGSVIGDVAVQAGGALAPGGFTAAGAPSTPGTLAVTGNLALSSGSAYDVQVGSTASKTSVSGSASLGGTVNAVFALGPAFSHQYTILGANAVTGTFSGLVNSGLPIGLTDTLTYDGSDAYLTLLVGPSTPGSLNRNQQAVVNALNGSLVQVGTLPTVFGSLTPVGLTQASGELGAAPRQAVSQAGGGFLQSFFDGGLPDPSASDRTGADIAMFYAPLPTKKAPAVAALPAPFTPYWTVWSTTFGGHASIDGNSGYANTLTGNNWTQVVGAEYRMARDTAVGFGFGGGSTNFSVTNGGGSGHYNFGEVAAYATREFNSIYVSGGVGGGSGSVKTNCADPYALQLQASYTASNFAGRVEAGDKFTVAPGAVLAPYGAVQLNYAALPAYSESAYSQFALDYASQNVTDTTGELGFRVKQDFTANGALVSVGGRLAWAYNFNTTESANASFVALPWSNFTVYGASPARNSALVDVGGKVVLVNGIALEARFDGQFGSGAQVYGGRGTVSYSF